MKLSEAKIKAAKPREREYKLADGHGLTLLVMPHGSKLWRFRVYQGGKENMLSLGAYPVVTLAAARDRALDLRRARVAAIAFQPFGDRYDLHALSTYPPAAVPAAKPTVLLGSFCDEWLAGYAKKQALTDATLSIKKQHLGYFVAELGKDLPLASLTAPLLHNAARKIAEQHGDTSAVRGLSQLKQVTAEGMAQGVLTSDPAASVNIAAPRKAVSRKGITDPAALGTMLKTIAAADVAPVSKLGLQLLALVYTRPVELMQAKWTEFDLDSDSPQWVIPAERMKLRREHVVPLSRQAVAILRELHNLTGDTGTVLTNNGGTPIGPNTFRNVLEKLGYKGKHDPHGFRVTASTMLAEAGHDESVIELSLAHAIPGVKGVYNRSHKLSQRRELAQFWADYLDTL
jgi:integrase